MKWLIFMIVLLVSLSGVAAIGVTPAKQTVSFEDNATYSFVYKILNQGENPVHIVMSATGSLASYVSFKNSFDVSGQSVYPLEVKLRLPDYKEISEYGQQIIRIRATEMSSAENGVFAATTAVEFWLVVQIPTKGKYAVIDSISLPSVKEGDFPLLEMNITNKGTMFLQNISWGVLVFNNRVLIEDYLFDGLTLEQEETVSLSKSFNITTPGEYSGYVWVDYGKGRVKKDISFIVGTSDILVKDYSVRVVSGQINRINLTFSSLWGSSLTGVKASILQSDGAFQDLPPLDIPAYGTKTLYGYMEIPKQSSSTYPVTLVIEIPVPNGDPIIKEIPLSMIVVQATTQEQTTSIPFVAYIIVIVILLLILFNVVWNKK